MNIHAMNGGMKVISPNKTHVLARNDPAIHETILSQLKTATKVEIVSTGSANSLVVRVTFPSTLRDDLIDETGGLMQGDARWLPTTGKPVNELILKCIVVSPEKKKYTYSAPNDKNTATMEDIRAEYDVQRRVFDETKHTVPICPDVITLLEFPNRDSFDAVFFNKTATPPNYKTSRVFNQLRIYFSLPYKPTVAMIVMESIPVSYKPLHHLKTNLHAHRNLIAQVCAMYVVLFYKCGLIALDAHLNNWLYDMAQPEQLRIRLIDFGLSLDVTNVPKRSEIIKNYFAKYPENLPAYSKLMGAGANAADSSLSLSPPEIMQQAILSVAVPDVWMASWLHKILVISMLMDGFVNILYSTTKQTCQMSHVFNVVYNDACVTMTHTLNTMRLDLREYLKDDTVDSDSKTHTMDMLDQISAYLLRYGYVKNNITSGRLGLDGLVDDYAGAAAAAATAAAMPMEEGEEGEEVIALSRYGGNKMKVESKIKPIISKLKLKLKLKSKKNKKSKKSKMHKKSIRRRRR